MGESAEQWHQRVTRELREQLIDDGALDDSIAERADWCCGEHYQQAVDDDTPKARWVDLPPWLHL